MGSVELVPGHQCFVITRKPPIPQPHLSEIHTVVHNLAHSGVTDPHLGFNRPIARPARSQGEDPLDQWSQLVRHQFSVSHVVARGRPIQPAPLACSLLHSHLHVLHQLLPVVLGKHPMKADVQPTRRGVEVDHTVVHRVQPNAVARKQSHQITLIARVSRQAVQPPHNDVHYPVRLHQRHQLLNPGPIKTRRRKSRVRDHHDRPKVMLACILPAPRRLRIGREVHLVLSGHPDVHHGQTHSRPSSSSLACVSRSPMFTSTFATRFRSRSSLGPSDGRPDIRTHIRTDQAHLGR